MILGFILFSATVFLAYSNGANDNFKGVATLYGSQTASYKGAIWWATISTFLGSIFSIFLAQTLLKNFSGKGLVPEAIATTTEFHLAVAIGAGVTVILATLTGFPISTTHGLTGALLGAGLMAVGNQVNFIALGESFFLPLLLVPIFAILFAMITYKIFHALRISSGITKEWCICIGKGQKLVPVSQFGANCDFNCAPLELNINTTDNCMEYYQGQFFGIKNQQMVDFSHFISAGVVGFARGLNDTPKMVALLLTFESISIRRGMLAIAIGIVFGGLLNARKVAETMGKKITAMNHGQGLSSNFTTGLMVITASLYGLPVSTTHVSVGSIFGVGLISSNANPNIFYQILLSWTVTLPLAGIIGAFAYWNLYHY